MNALIEDFRIACKYPGQLDAAAVETALSGYLWARGSTRKIVRLEKGLTLAKRPSLKEQVGRVLQSINYADSLAGQTVSEIRKIAVPRANAAFLENVLVDDLSLFALIYIGAIRFRTNAVETWAEPLYHAFLSGGWWLYWTSDTLYWVAKPTVHMETLPLGGRQLHNATGPALESDADDLYFWHGVRVPVPAEITLNDIKAASNMEVRRFLIEQYGYERYLRDAGLTLVDACADDHPLTGLRTARLFHDEVNQITLLDMLNSTPEPDGSVKRYVVSVDSEAYQGRAGRECLAAMASTWRRRSDHSLYFRTPEDYWPIAES